MNQRVKVEGAIGQHNIDRPTYGFRVIRFLIGIAGKYAGRDIRIVPMVINGSAGALIYLDGEIDHTLSMAIDGEKIAAIYIVRNPDKLLRAPVN